MLSHAIATLGVLVTLLVAHTASTQVSSSSPLPSTASLYSTSRTAYRVPTMDITDKTVDVYYPSGAAASGRRFPLISFAHGLAGGGSVDWLAYNPLLSHIASHGYIVASPRACDLGCAEHCRTLWGDPPCWGNYYQEQLKVLAWAQTNASRADPVMSAVNHTVGYGVSGHSMGGQATLFSSSFENATRHNIKAAVMHHAFTDSEYPAPTVPFLAFTGTYDVVAFPEQTQRFFDAAATAGKVKHRGLVNKKDASHLEPIFYTNDVALATYTSAWMKLYLEGKDTEHGVDYRSLLYGTASKDSLCNGGDGALKTCIVL